MYKIQCLNKISEVGTSRFSDAYTCGTDVQNPDAILVRSASMHEMEFNPELLAIARAGAGVNNIPLDRCSENGIVVFRAPTPMQLKSWFWQGCFLPLAKLFLPLSGPKLSKARAQK